MCIRRAAISALGVVLAAALAACGGDDEQSAGITAACEAQVGMVVGFADVIKSVPGLSPYSSPEPEESAQLQTAYDVHVAAPLAALVANAPDELVEEVQRVAAAAADFRSTGDPFSLDTDEFGPDTDSIDAYMQENCKGAKAAVEAIEYEYKELPRSLPAGAVRLSLRNTGKEAHEMSLVGRKPGVTESYDQILALPLNELPAKLTLIDLTITDPGRTGHLVADLTAGEYMVICTIGKGTTDSDLPTGDEPHFALGMRQEVTVG